MAAAEGSARSRGRWALGLSLLLAIFVLFVVAGGVYRWLWILPPPAKIELTELPVPDPGDLLDWSPDGKRLLVANRRGEMWSVEMATGRVSTFPAFRPTTWSAMWGPDGQPLAFNHENPALTHIWRLQDGEWKRLPLRCVQPAPSPDRKRVAFMTGRELVRDYWLNGRRPFDASGFRPGHYLRVANLLTGTTLRDIALPPLEYPQIHWANDETLIIRGQVERKRQVFQCNIATGKLRPAEEPHWPPKEPPLRLEYASTRIRDQDLRNRLSKLGVPGLPLTDDRDWWLVVRDLAGAEVKRYALGRRAPDRRSTTGAFHTWKCARPDGSMQRWAVLSAYERLHVLELPTVTGSREQGDRPTSTGHRGVPKT